MPQLSDWGGQHNDGKWKVGYSVSVSIACSCFANIVPLLGKAGTAIVMT